MDTYKRLLKYTPEKIHCAYISVVCAVLGVASQMGAFWFLWKFLYALLVSKNITDGSMYATVIVSLLAGYSVVYFCALWASHVLGFRLESNLRKTAINHLMNASFAFFDMNPSGKIRKLIDDNAQETHMLVAHLIPDNISALFTPIFMFIIVFAVDVKLGLLLLAVALIGGAQMMFMMGNKDFMRKYQAALERMNAEAVEYVRGMQLPYAVCDVSSAV